MTSTPNIEYQSNQAVMDILSQFKATPSTMTAQQNGMAQQTTSQAPQTDQKINNQPEKTSPEPSVDHQKNDGKEESQKNDSDKKEEEKEIDDSDNSETKDFKKLYEDLSKKLSSKEKMADDNQRFARKVFSTISKVKDVISEMVENNDIEQDLADRILEVANSHGDVSDGILPTATSKKEDVKHDALEEIAIKARDALTKYLELSPDEEIITKNAHGYDLHLKSLSEEQRQDLIKTLKKSEDNPKALLKEMLSLGQQFWESRIGRGIEQHGNLISIIDAQDVTISDLTKKIEKLERKSQESSEDTSFKKTVAPSSQGRSFIDEITKPSSKTIRSRMTSQGVPSTIIDHFIDK